MRKLGLSSLVVLMFFLISGCKVEINPTSDIQVWQDSTEIIFGTSEYDFGQILVGKSSPEVTFTITNIGKTKLYLTDEINPISISDDTAGFTIDQSSTISVLKINELTTFTVTFTPKDEGEVSATIIIHSTDYDEEPFQFQINGAGVIPEINVRQDSTDIPSGSGIFNFGSLKVGESSPTVTFTVENVGTGNLELTASPDIINVINFDAAMFSVNQSSIKSSLSSKETTTFTITFTPSNIGVKNTTILIENSDRDKSPYHFTVTGEGHTAPEINVKQDTKDIPSGSGSYNFGEILVAEAPISAVFTIENHGTINLELTGSTKFIDILGTDAAMFSADESLTFSPISYGSTTTFSISFNPTSPGTKSATVSIPNTDYDENPYTFTVTALCVEPEIKVTDSTSKDIPCTTGIFEFTKTTVNNSTTEEFIIHNLGNGELRLSGSPYVEISNDVSNVFSVTTQPASSISPGSSSKFQIKFEPANEKNYTATVTIANNDLDENPFTFTINGRGKEVKFDFNGDGKEDIIMGAYQQSTGSKKYNGKAFIFFGKTSHSSSIGAGAADVIFIGDDDYDHFGISVAPIGDFNGDGYDDVIIGAYRKTYLNQVYCGYAYIFFGSSTPYNKYARNANVIISGEGSFNNFGNSVASAGDVNGDGFDDVIVGAPGRDYSPVVAGSAYIFYGSSNTTQIINASSANVKLNCENSTDLFGYTVSSAGDFNNDGFDDLIVGAPYNDVGGMNAGSAYMYFGKSSMPNIINSQNASITMRGESTSDNLGWSVSYAGDFNNDMLDDVIISAKGASITTGAAFMLYGNATFSGTINASNANIKFIGESSHDAFGYSVSNARDVNNDGISDLIISSFQDPGYAIGPGCVHVFFGKSSPASTIYASNANVKYTGTKDREHFGASISSIGDFNCDGIDDIIVGTPNDEDNGFASGCVFVFYGSKTPSTPITSSSANIRYYGDERMACLGISVAGGK